MPAKKTFPSIRVRGLAQIDGALNKGNRPVPAFKEYVARLSQPENDVPEVTILVNTLGGAPVWEYLDNGSFTLNLVGGFAEDKTLVAFAGNNAAHCNPTDITNDSIGIETHAGSGALADGVFAQTFIEVRVY
jgi:hypothetical protein